MSLHVNVTGISCVEHSSTEITGVVFDQCRFADAVVPAATVQFRCGCACYLFAVRDGPRWHWIDTFRGPGEPPPHECRIDSPPA